MFVYLCDSIFFMHTEIVCYIGVLVFKFETVEVRVCKETLKALSTLIHSHFKTHIQYKQL